MERYDKFKNSSKEIKNTYKQIVQAQKKLNQMKYINKLSGELIDIADKKLAPLINDSFSYTRDFFAYSKQENNIFTFDNSKFEKKKKKKGLWYNTAMDNWLLLVNIVLKVCKQHSLKTNMIN